jgi:hypothetical protein
MARGDISPIRVAPSDGSATTAQLRNASKAVKQASVGFDLDDRGELLVKALDFAESRGDGAPVDTAGRRGDLAAKARTCACSSGSHSSTYWPFAASI